MTSTARPVVLVSWDGTSPPLAMIHLDAAPAFDWLLFDYTGRHAAGPCEQRGQAVEMLSTATECKGEIYQALADHLHARNLQPEYVALIDDDILLGVADINRALHLARAESLDVFSPALSHDSFYTHRWSLQQPHRLFRDVDWVEVMMPFYRGELLLAARENLAGNVSSWGIDKYLMPTLQQLLKLPRTALLDSVMASHRRPITSGTKRYRNGKTAGEEREAMKARCQALITERAPQLLGSAWYRRVFEQRHVHTPWQRFCASLGRPIRRWLDQST